MSAGGTRTIAALVCAPPGVSPGQRTRIEFWASHLEDYGWKVDFYALEDERLHDVLYQPGNAAAKAKALLSCYRRQLGRVWRLGPCDAVFVYREAALFGPAVLERLALRSGSPLVYDLDDPTFVRYRSPTNGWASLLKFPGKARSLFRMANQVITVNRLIGDYAARFNPSVTVIPMFVDTDHYRPLDRPAGGPPTLVWSGSHSTMANVRSIGPALRRLQADRQTPLRVVGEGSFDLPGVTAEVREFAVSREVTDLQDCHIGLVPLNNIPWNHWKFFFKAVQYMAVGLPVVAQRMGSNDEIVDDGVTGFVVETQDEWYERLRQLVDDPELRERMGKAARASVVERFSVQAQMPAVASVFDRAAAAV